jgi:hypothetical protein
MATRQEIEKLKQDWASDPIWDIETTEGFEGHERELHEFAESKRAEWKQREADRLEAKAVALGCPGNLTLAAYIERLEARLGRLGEGIDSAIDRLEGRLDAIADKAGRAEDQIGRRMRDLEYDR